MRFVAALLFFMSTSLVVLAAPPAGTVKIVNEHQDSVSNKKDYRYISMNNILADEREKAVVNNKLAAERENAVIVTSFILNSVSRRRAITVPKVIDHVIVVNLDDYDIPAKTWDTFAFSEPYSKITDGPMATKKQGDPRLIIRADWFISKASVAPHYYNLLRIWNQKDFENLVALTRNDMEQAAIITFGNVARSHRHARRIPTIYGGAWIIYDDHKADFMNNLLATKFTQAEFMAPLANGLNAYFMSDKKGTRLDYGDVTIVTDPNFTDKVYRVGRSCIVCHEHGVKDFTDGVRKLTKREIGIMSTNKEDLRNIKDLFSRDLPFKRDQDLYRESVKYATGHTPAYVSKKLKECIDGYDAPVTKTMAMRELGWNIISFNKYAKASNDPYILTLYNGDTIKRHQWEEIFPTVTAGR